MDSVGSAEKISFWLIELATETFHQTAKNISDPIVTSALNLLSLLQILDVKRK